MSRTSYIFISKVEEKGHVQKPSQGWCEIIFHEIIEWMFFFSNVLIKKKESQLQVLSIVIKVTNPILLLGSNILTFSPYKKL